MKCSYAIAVPQFIAYISLAYHDKEWWLVNLNWGWLQWFKSTFSGMCGKYNSDWEGVCTHPCQRRIRC